MAAITLPPQQLVADRLIFAIFSPNHPKSPAVIVDNILQYGQKQIPFLALTQIKSKV
jgi:hypothetical protein